MIEAGTRYGRLTVVRRDGSRKYECACDCGEKTSVFADNLNRGRSRSCGCLRREATAAKGRRETTHGFTGTPTWETWHGMRQRCDNPRATSYRYYGARGITVCERWQTFENFLADMGERPQGKTLDRIDNDGNYEPGNCRWATPKEQAENRKRKDAHGVK